MLNGVMQPIELGPNQPRQFYKGGEAIAELRGVGEGDAYRPEDLSLIHIYGAWPCSIRHLWT